MTLTNTNYSKFSLKSLLEKQETIAEFSFISSESTYYSCEVEIDNMEAICVFIVSTEKHQIELAHLKEVYAKNLAEFFVGFEK